MFEYLKKEIKNKENRIVFPEGDDLRILRTGRRLLDEKLCQVIVLGEESEILKIANENSLSLAGFKIIDLKKDADFNNKVELLFELRKGKNTREECHSMLQSRNYYAVMLVKMGIADASLGGATYSTADTIRPALQIIKAKDGVKLVSSCFLMIKEGNIKYIMGDCAINENPSSFELVDIAISSAQTGKMFGIDPRVALLSYSTHGSAKSEIVDKVKNAVELLKKEKRDFVYDGEIQFDAAISKEVRKKKAPTSNLLDDANIFIFPDLNSGNIGYKIAQRLGGYEAVGPIIQGLAKPINDLSRGCNEEEVYKMSIITLLQI